MAGAHNALIAGNTGLLGCTTQEKWSPYAGTLAEAGASEARTMLSALDTRDCCCIWLKALMPKGPGLLEYGRCAGLRRRGHV